MGMHIESLEDEVEEMARKVYVITGGSDGIGLAAAQEAAKKNDVIIVARSEDKLKAAVASFAKGNHWYVSADLSIEGSATQVIEKVIAKYKRIDVLINSAGTFDETPFTKTPPDKRKMIFALNYHAAEEACYTALRQMEQQKSGTIVNVSSIAGLKSYKNEAIYGTSKAAINKLTEQLALEYKVEKGAQQTIYVLALAPGSVDTPLIRKALEPKRAFLEKEVFKTFTLDQYYERILTPAQVGKRIVELAESPQSAEEPVVVMQSYEF